MHGQTSGEVGCMCIYMGRYVLKHKARPGCRVASAHLASSLDAGAQSDHGTIIQ